MTQLALFVRTPRLGEVKTRLAAALGPESALRLYRAFVEDTLDLLASLKRSRTLDVVLWTAGAPDQITQGWAAAVGAPIRQQPDGDLGVRIDRALTRGLVDHERVVVLGSDAPTLPAGLVARVIGDLDHADIALGPTSDGGYYAIGTARGFRPELSGVRWSTRHVLADTLAANGEALIAQAPPWYDIDGPDDLILLKTHLALTPSAAPTTAGCLRRLRKV